MKLSHLTLTVGLYSQSTYGWGFFGHRLIGNLAEPFLSPETSAAIGKLIPNCNRGCLGRISPWADKIKNRPEYRFSKSLHYINTGDNPPDTCSSGAAFLCQPGVPCVVDAIQNYTQRLMDESLPVSHRQDALRFLVHYIEDIHQPLHLSGKKRGGNGERVKFNKRMTNLHRVWDSQLLTQRIKVSFSNKAPLYLSYLQSKLQGEWSSIKDTWISCPVTKSDPKVFPNHIVCPLKWGQELNPLNCDLIWRFDSNEDLALSYYNRTVALDLPDKLMAMAAIRLASTLNAVFAQTKAEKGSSFLYQSSTSQDGFVFE